MAFRPVTYLRRRVRERAARQWSGLDDNVPGLGRSRLLGLSIEARSLRTVLDHFLQCADEKLRLSQARLDDIDLPAGTDWRWRPAVLSGVISPSGMAAPESGQAVGQQVRLWHDCPLAALILRQTPNDGATDLSPYGLRLEVMGFQGSYLSLSIDMPQSSLEGLTGSHILRLETDLRVERPLDIYARLNIQHGPNTENILRHMGAMQPGQPNRTVTEFDLALTEMNEKRLDKIWLDLIFEAPSMNAVTLSDAVMSRHLRADV